MGRKKSMSELRAEGRAKQEKVSKMLAEKGDQGRGFRNKKHVDLLSFNAGAEDKFVSLVREMIEDGPKGSGTAIPVSDVIRECAYELDVSTTTVKRYLTKHSARRAEFRVMGEMVMLNPNYELPDDE